MVISLVRPTAALLDSWAAAVKEFGGVHIDGAGLRDDIEPTRSELAAFLEKAALFASDLPLDGDAVRADHYWVVDGEEVVGFITLRRELNEYFRTLAGHIGYSVRPSRRREGIARAALVRVLDRARDLGIDRVMVSCAEANIGSARTIESAGGVLQDVFDASEHGFGNLRRYWITL